jgi:hypothetical protein
MKLGVVNFIGKINVQPKEIDFSRIVPSFVIFFFLSATSIPVPVLQAEFRVRQHTSLTASKSATWYPCLKLLSSSMMLQKDKLKWNSQA